MASAIVWNGRVGEGKWQDDDNGSFKGRNNLHFATAAAGLRSLIAAAVGLEFADQAKARYL